VKIRLGFSLPDGKKNTDLLQGIVQKFQKMQN